jgi:hypothetical protein
MSAKERYLLLLYLLRQSDALDVDLEYALNMVLKTRADPLDCLELIIAKTRHDLFHHVSSCILDILNMNPE